MEKNIKDSIMNAREHMDDVLIVEPEESVDDWVDNTGKEVACGLNRVTQSLVDLITEFTSSVRYNKTYMSEEDIKKSEELIASLKSSSLWLQQMAAKYDGISPDKKASQAISKIAKQIRTKE